MVLMRDYKDLEDAFRREDAARYAQSKRDGANGELTLKAVATYVLLLEKRITANEEEIKKLKKYPIGQIPKIKPKAIKEHSRRACHPSVDANKKLLGVVPLEKPQQCLEWCKVHGNVNACWVKMGWRTDARGFRAANAMSKCFAILGGVTHTTRHEELGNTCWIFSY